MVEGKGKERGEMSALHANDYINIFFYFQCQRFLIFFRCHFLPAPSYEVQIEWRGEHSVL